MSTSNVFVSFFHIIHSPPLLAHQLLHFSTRCLLSQLVLMVLYLQQLAQIHLLSSSFAKFTSQSGELQNTSPLKMVVAQLPINVWFCSSLHWLVYLTQMMTASTPSHSGQYRSNTPLVLVVVCHQEYSGISHPFATCTGGVFSPTMHSSNMTGLVLCGGGSCMCVLMYSGVVTLT